MSGKNFERFAYLFLSESAGNPNNSITHTSSNIPYPYCFIKATGSKEVGLVIKVDAKHKVRVSFQNLDRCALGSSIEESKRPGWGGILQG